ncbi:hypothetical protein ACFLZX_01720 [Nanoarchaeota archaeon]
MEEIVEEGKNTPEKKFSCGAVVATVWNNNGKSKDGEKVAFRTVSFQRRYKMGDEWKTSNSLRINDLPKAALVLNESYKFLVMRSEE